MAFDPSEPRGEHGRWIKIAQGLKNLSSGDQGTITKAIGELPKGGKGNRTSIRGVEIRRHQSGAVNVKIGGMSRHYSSHEEAARAVISRKHVGEHAGTPASDTHIPKPSAKPTSSAQAKAPGGKLGGSGKGPSGGVTGKRKGEMGKSDEQFKAEQGAKKVQNLKDEAAKLEDILASKALRNKLKGKGAANDPATLKQENRLQYIYDQLAAYAGTKKKTASQLMDEELRKLRKHEK